MSKYYLYQPWRYGRHLLIGIGKGRKLPNPQYHKVRLEVRKLEIKETYEKVEATLKSEYDPIKVVGQYFPYSLPKIPKFPSYYTFYRPKGSLVTKEDMEL